MPTWGGLDFQSCAHVGECLLAKISLYRGTLLTLQTVRHELDEWMDGWMDGCMDAWMHGWMNEWVGGWGIGQGEFVDEGGGQT